jgi:hypothetical protein
MLPPPLPRSPAIDLTCLRGARVRSRGLRRRAAAVRRVSRRLRRHTRVERTRYQSWRQRYLLVACAWCQTHLSWQYLDKPFVLPIVDALPTSHGICPSCLETQLRELHRRKP